jgi:hypothetical protein
MEFVSRYTDETVRYIYPIAEAANMYMVRELNDLVASRCKHVIDFAKIKQVEAYINSQNFF